MQLSAGGHAADDANVALNNRGEAVATWEEEVPGNLIEKQRAPAPRMDAVRPGRQAQWQAPTPIAGEGGAPVGLDLGGEALAVWEAPEGLIQSAVGSVPGSGWQVPVNVSTPESQAESAPEMGARMAMNASGRAVLVWEHHERLRNRVYAAFGSATNGRWGAPTLLSDSSWAHNPPAPCPPGADCPRNGLPAASPSVAIDPQGDALAVWERSTDGHSDGTIQAVSGANGLWQRPFEIAPAGGRPVVRLDTRGDGVLLWESEPTGMEARTFSGVFAAVRHRK